MIKQEIKDILLHDLPELFENDAQVRDSILRLFAPSFSPRQETESRFDRMMDEFQRRREESEQQWAEDKRRWEANQAEIQRLREESERRWAEDKRRWEANQAEIQRLREESERNWQEFKAELRTMREESERRWQEQDRKWEEQDRRWEAQDRKWEANQAELQKLREESDSRWQETKRFQSEMREESDSRWQETKRFQSEMRTHIGAMGARWGKQSEHSFREALRGILDEVPGVDVLHINEFDEEGMVFDGPDQVELDIVIRNGLLLICEIKSSVEKSDVIIFERKVKFYEKNHQRQVSQKIIISPMVDKRAMKKAQSLGMIVYNYPEEMFDDEEET